MELERSQQNSETLFSEDYPLVDWGILTEEISVSDLQDQLPIEEV